LVVGRFGLDLAHEDITSIDELILVLHMMFNRRAIPGVVSDCRRDSERFALQPQPATVALDMQSSTSVNGNLRVVVPGITTDGEDRR
jgi:hypothetical protein